MLWPSDKRRWRRLAPAAVCLPLWLGGGAGLAAETVATADAAPPRLTISRRADGGTIGLHWPQSGIQSPTLTATVEGAEVSLRFSRPLGAAPLEKIPQQLAGWVDNILYGHDSLLLLVNDGASAAVRKTADGVVIDFTAKPRAATAAADEAAATRADLARLDYLAAVVDMEEGRVRKARAALAALADRNPRDVQSVQLLAAAEERLGRWRQALRRTQQASGLTPGEAELARARARLLYAHGDYVRLDHDVYAVRNADTQRISKLTGRRSGDGGGMLTYMLENRRIDADRVTRQGGAPLPFHGFRRQATLAYTQDWPEMQASRVSLFAADATLGAGLQHEWRGDDRALRFGGHWREPAYSLLEGAVDGGWRSRAYGEIDARLSRRWLLAATFGLNGYGLAREDGQLASSATVSGTLTYVLREADPGLSLAYIFDAEYVIDNKYLTDSAGNPYHPLSLASRETHGVQAAFERSFSDYFSWSVSAGYAWDRRAKGGPLAAIALRYEPLADLELGLRASHARATSRGEADAVDSAGGYLMWRY